MRVGVAPPKTSHFPLTTNFYPNIYESPMPVKGPTSASSVDHYAILGILPTADPTTIKKAYHKQALKYHPDKNPGERKPLAQLHMQKINTAFEVLRDPSKKAAYDSARPKLQPSPARPPKHTTSRAGFHYASHTWQESAYSSNTYGFRDGSESWYRWYRDRHEKWKHETNPSSMPKTSKPFSTTPKPKTSKPSTPKNFQSNFKSHSKTAYSNTHKAEKYSTAPQPDEIPRKPSQPRAHSTFEFNFTSPSERSSSSKDNFRTKTEPCFNFGTWSTTTSDTCSAKSSSTSAPSPFKFRWSTMPGQFDTSSRRKEHWGALPQEENLRSYKFDFGAPEEAFNPQKFAKPNMNESDKFSSFNFQKSKSPPQSSKKKRVDLEDEPEQDAPRQTRGRYAAGSNSTKPPPEFLPLDPEIPSKEDYGYMAPELDTEMSDDDPVTPETSTLSSRDSPDIHKSTKPTPSPAQSKTPNINNQDKGTFDFTFSFPVNSSSFEQKPNSDPQIPRAFQHTPDSAACSSHNWFNLWTTPPQSSSQNTPHSKNSSKYRTPELIEISDDEQESKSENPSQTQDDNEDQDNDVISISSTEEPSERCRDPHFDVQRQQEEFSKIRLEFESVANSILTSPGLVINLAPHSRSQKDIDMYLQSLRKHQSDWAIFYSKVKQYHSLWSVFEEKYTVSSITDFAFLEWYLKAKEVDQRVRKTISNEEKTHLLVLKHFKGYNEGISTWFNLRPQAY